MFERIVRVDGRPLTAQRALPDRASLARARAPCPATRALPARRAGARPARHAHARRRQAHGPGASGGSRAQRRTAEAAILVDNQPPRRGTVALVGEATASEALTAVPSGFTGQDVAYELPLAALRRAGRGLHGDRRRRSSAPTRCAPATSAAASAPSSPRPTAAAACRWRRRRAPSSAGRARARAAVSRRGTAPRRDRLTAWLERGSRRLRSTTVRWPARVRIRGRLTDRHRSPAGPHDGANARARRRPRAGARSPAYGRARDGRLTTFTRIGPSRHLRLRLWRRVGDAAPPVRATRPPAASAARAR